MLGIGFFNDMFCDVVKGNIFYFMVVGFVFGNGEVVEIVMYGIVGFFGWKVLVLIVFEFS